MKIKVYYFRYANTLDKFMMNLLSFFVNFAFPIVTFYAIAIITGIFGINKYLGADVLTVLLIVSIALGLICGIKFCVCFKGITLYDSYMEISTQTIGFGKNKPKIIIRYDDISSVFQNTYNLRYSRKKARKTFIAGDYQDYVELTLKGGKQFCFSVENQKEFIEELKKRRNKDSTDEN